MVELPLFGANDTVAGALVGLGGYPGLVSERDAGFRFHHAGELAQAIAPLAVTLLASGGAREVSATHIPLPAYALGDIPGRVGGVLTPALLGASLFDLRSPRPEVVARLCEQLHADFLIAAAPPQLAGSLVTVFAHPLFDMRISRRIYRCSAYGEAYDEQVYRDNGGDCPVHNGGRLA